MKSFIIERDSTFGPMGMTSQDMFGSLATFRNYSVISTCVCHHKPTTSYVNLLLHTCTQLKIIDLERVSVLSEDNRFR